MNKNKQQKNGLKAVYCSFGESPVVAGPAIASIVPPNNPNNAIQTCGQVGY